MPQDQPCFRSSFPATLIAAREAARSAAAFLGAQGLDEAELFACELALVEAANNAVQQASREQLAQPVTISVVLTPGCIELSIEDHTDGFELSPRIDPPSPMVERGRGLFLIQSLMDEVRYIRGDGSNVLHLRKRRSSGSVRNHSR